MRLIYTVQSQLLMQIKFSLKSVLQRRLKSFALPSRAVIEWARSRLLGLPPHWYHGCICIVYRLFAVWPVAVPIVIQSMLSYGQPRTTTTTPRGTVTGNYRSCGYVTCLSRVLYSCEDAIAELESEYHLNHILSHLLPGYDILGAQVPLLSIPC
jgi:hypothetical protein